MSPEGFVPSIKRIQAQIQFGYDSPPSHGVGLAVGESVGVVSYSSGHCGQVAR